MLVLVAVVVGIALMRMEWGDDILKRLCCVRNQDEMDLETVTEPQIAVNVDARNKYPQLFDNY